MPVSVVIADDRLMIRESLRMALHGAGLRVAGGVPALHEALLLCRAAKAGILLVDEASPGLDAAQAALRVPRFSPHSRVVALAETADTLRTALAAGVRGYLLWSQRCEDIVRGILEVAAGETHISRDALDALAAGRAIA